MQEEWGADYEVCIFAEICGKGKLIISVRRHRKRWRGGHVGKKRKPRTIPRLSVLINFFDQGVS